MIPPCVLFELGFLEIFSRFRRFSGRPLELAGKGWKRKRRGKAAFTARFETAPPENEKRRRAGHFDERPGNRENRMFQKLTVEGPERGLVMVDSLKRPALFILFYLA